MLNALENLGVFKGVCYNEQSRRWRIKLVTLFCLKQKSEFKDKANVHTLIMYRLPKSSNFLGDEILIAVEMKV